MALIRLVLGATLMVGCGGGSESDSPEASVVATASSESAAPAADKPQASAQEGRTNSPPRIESVRFDPERATTQGSLRAVVEVSDVDEDSVWLEHTWQIDGENVGEMPRLSLRGVEKGTRIDLTVVAHDGVGPSEPWEATTQVENAIPEIGRVQVEPGEPFIAGEPLVVKPTTSDDDGDPVEVEYRWSVNGILRRESGARFETDELRRGDVVSVEVIASDGEDRSEPREIPNLVIANAPPKIVSMPGDGSDGGVFYQVRAEDPDGDVRIRFGLENAPRGMTVDELSGAVHWEPTPEQAGTHTVTVTADDRRGGLGRQTIEVSVGGGASGSDTGSAPAARER